MTSYTRDGIHDGQNSLSLQAYRNVHVGTRLNAKTRRR